MRHNPIRFEVPGMDDASRALYTQLYGDAGSDYINILSASPDEIAVISRLIAHLMAQKGA